MWGNHPEWKPVLDRLIAAFEKTHPGIEVELSYKPGPQYTAALNTALAGGAAPDVIGWIEGDAIRVGAKAKQIIPLDGKIPLGRLIPAARAQVAFNDHVYGSPLAAYTVGIFYQRPIFKKYGLKPPTNWPQLLAVTKKLKRRGGDAVVDARQGHDHPVLLLHHGRLVDPRPGRVPRAAPRHP